MPVKQDTVYQKKIEDLKAEHQKAAQAVDSKRGELDQVSGDVKRLQKEKGDLEGRIADLKHELENQDKAIERKRGEADSVLKEVSAQIASAQLTRDSLVFEAEQLEKKIARRQQKADELASLEKRFDELTVKIAQHEQLAKQIADLNADNEAKAKKQLEAALRKVGEIAAREANVATAEEKLRRQAEHIEFYRNRIVQYLQEKGLPPMPDFNEA